MSYNTKQHRLPNNPPKERNNMPEKITIPLSEKYTNPAEIFLDTGIAYKIANKMGDIAPHQLRKILNVLKESVTIVKRNPNKFIDARNKLYYIVPLTAYNTGRNKGLQELYNFVYQHINEKAIQSPKDIEILDQIFTSIIAYHKVLNQNKKEK